MTTSFQRLRTHGDRVARGAALDFAVNVWPELRPDWLEQALQQALGGGYPDQRAAVEAIAERHRRRPEEVLLLNGACEGFWLLGHTLRPRVACCIHPSFTEPEAALRAVGSDIARVYRRPPAWRLDRLQVSARTDYVVLGNPNNPTGALDPAATVATLAKAGRTLVADESFMEFAPDENESLAGRDDLPDLVVVRSLTKLWALAGIRAGYLIAPASLVKRLRGQRQPWSVNTLACAALAACSRHEPARRQRALEIAAERDALAAQLASLPDVRVFPSVTNFLLLRVSRAHTVQRRLRANGIAVRPAGTFPGLSNSYLRVAVRTATDNQQLVRALAQALSDD